MPGPMGFNPIPLLFCDKLKSIKNDETGLILTMNYSHFVYTKCWAWGSDPKPLNFHE